jgi:hypothetical protein
MPRDLPCQATSIQSVLFTEGPVEARREFAHVEQPTSASVAPSQDTLRGLPGAESQVQVPGRGSRRSRPHPVLPVLPRRDQPYPLAPAQGAGVPARPAVLVFAAGSRQQPRAGRTTDRAPAAHARPSAACVFCRVVTGPPAPQFTSFRAPDRVMRLAAARVRRCKNRNHQPSAQASVLPRCRTARDRGRGNRPERARAEAPTPWQLLRFSTTVEWAPWRGCNHA